MVATLRTHRDRPRTAVVFDMMTDIDRPLAQDSKIDLSTESLSPVMVLPICISQGDNTDMDDRHGTYNVLLSCSIGLQQCTSRLLAYLFVITHDAVTPSK